MRRQKTIEPLCTDLVTYDSHYCFIFETPKFQIFAIWFFLSEENRCILKDLFYFILDSFKISSVNVSNKNEVFSISVQSLVCIHKNHLLKMLFRFFNPYFFHQFFVDECPLFLLSFISCIFHLCCFVYRHLQCYIFIVAWGFYELILK